MDTRCRGLRLSSLTLVVAASMARPAGAFAAGIPDAGEQGASAGAASLTATSLGKDRPRPAADGASRGLAGAEAPSLWDNGPPNGVNAYSNATAKVFGARRTLLDDFDVPEDGWTLQSLRWNSVWGSGVPNLGVGAEISIRSDAAGTPGAAIAIGHVTGYDEAATGNIFFSREEVTHLAEFDDINLEAGHYWFEAVVQGPENNFWLTGDQRGAECWVNYEDQGGLQPGSAVFGAASDVNWILGGVGGSCFPTILVTDPGFEGNPLRDYQHVINDFTTYEGDWGAEAGAVVGAENGVTPADGAKMLRMTASALYTQVVQPIDVSALASLIDSGTLMADFTASFNAHPGIAAASAYPMLRFFTAADYGTLTSSIANSFTLDADPATWEVRTASSNIPPGTRWIIVETAYESATIGSLPGYVDAASLCIRRIAGSAPNCRVYWTRYDGGGERITSAAYNGAGESTYRLASANLNGHLIFHPGFYNRPASVYWREGPVTYYDAAYAPGTPVVLGGSGCPAEFSYFAASQTKLFHSCQQSGLIYKLDLANGAGSAYAASPGTIRGLAVHAGTLYAATDTKIHAYTPGSGWQLRMTIPNLPSGSQASVRSIAFDDTSGELYVLGAYSSQIHGDQPFLLRINASWTAITTLLLNPPGGGSPVGYLPLPNHGLAVDGATRYAWWTCRNGAGASEVRRLSLASPGAPIVIATSYPNESFVGIAVSRCATAIFGDVDGDGDVNFTDLLAVLANWGPCGAPCPADIDGDGIVSFADLLLVLANWG